MSARARPDVETIRAEVDRNYEAFTAALSQLLEHHRGAFALMRDGAVVEIFDTVREAHRAAKQRYQDDLYSIQEITDAPFDVTYLCQVLDSRSD